MAADAPAIFALIESAYRGDSSRRGWTNEADLIEGDRTSLAEVSGFISQSLSRFVVASEGTQLVGCALIRNLDGEGYFGMFAVNPALQGGGLGKQILSFAEGKARELWGCKSMAMTAISIREELIAFYERRGYRRSGTKPFPFENEPGVQRRDFHLVVLSKSLA